jgi:hypothetical protein
LISSKWASIANLLIIKYRYIQIINKTQGKKSTIIEKVPAQPTIATKRSLTAYCDAHSSKERRGDRRSAKRSVARK